VPYSQIGIWIEAARLRTLPLSVAGILAGNGLALSVNAFSWVLFVGTLLTAISFQILSNFANDYGDGIKGTDNDNRIGPKRILQQNLISAQMLFRGIVLTGIISLILSLGIIVLAFGLAQIFFSIAFLVLAVFAIWAAYKYTAGKGAYGYRALGDVFVFVFFGLVAVVGSFFLQANVISPSTLWFSLSIGAYSVGVLNLNNMRDMQNDAAVGKKTMATILGLRLAKRYHSLLLLFGIIGLVFGICAVAQTELHYLPLIVIVPILVQLLKTTKTQKHAAFDEQLKPLALTTFGFSMLFFLTQLFF
jgi:1,4-dihydroxy-2-naphthoate octaprenyltransferase